MKMKKQRRTIVKINKKDRTTEVNRYLFSLIVAGHGKDTNQAWLDAVKALCLDPGDAPHDYKIDEDHDEITEVQADMIILCCGDRKWRNRDLVFEVLSQYPIHSTVIHGACGGLDWIADKVATDIGMASFRFYPKWATYGKAAGPIRSQRMIDYGPDVVLAFHDNLCDSKGTAGTIRRARKAGIETKIFTSF
jgi:hypothetical protein